MKIRKATPEETEKIRKRSVKLVEESSMGFLEPDEGTVSQLFDPFFQNGAYYLVTVKERSFLGWILVGSAFDPFTNEAIGFLFDIYVKPTLRRTGVGKELVKEALIQLKKEGYRKVHLNVFAGNPSRRLAEQFGFKEVFTVMERVLD